MDCIPPWLSANNQCYSNITTYNQTSMDIYRMIQNKFMTTKENSELTEAEIRCKDPCKKMINKVTLRAKNDMLISDSALLTLRFKKTIKVEKKVVHYNWFNFIIDVGSSLGLWLGLSALSCLDITIEALTVVKKWLK